VNGSENERPFNEDDIPRPSGPYAISKFEAEKGLWEIAKETGLEVVVIRPPLVIGPNAPGNFGLLIRAVCKGIPLPLGLIHNKRSIVSLENLADFILLCAQHQKAANETFCIADDEDISTPKLLKLLAVAMGKPSRLISVSPAILKFTAAMIGKRAVFDKVCGSLRVDSSKAKRLLNWHPRLTTSAQIILIAEKLKADSIA
jgi:nucleoside-diphosphate-sugar epimerase